MLKLLCFFVVLRTLKINIFSIFMSKQLLNIFGISSSNLQSSSFALILEVETTSERIPIIIGPSEAQAIAIEMEDMAPSRPLTHDLMKTALKSFNIDLQEVIINKFKEGVFYSKLILSDGIQTIEIDSRTSDAIALAVRFKVPIYALDLVIKETAMTSEVDFDDPLDELLEDAEPELTIEELEEYLDKLIEEENYEEASKIRDEINLRKDANRININ